MIRRILNTIRSILFFFSFLIKIALGGVLLWGAFWLLGKPELTQWANGTLGRAAFWQRMETAVKVVGGLFLSTWVLRFLDQFLFRGRLISRFGFFARAPLNVFRMFTYPFIHGDHNHLVGNTIPLLFCAGAAVFLLPKLSLLLPVALFLITIQGLIVWIFGGRSAPQIGASGLALGLFSFDVVHGLISGVSGMIIALLLVAFFGRTMGSALKSRGMLPNGAKISVAGHWGGFLSGILTAYLISPLGPLSVV